MLDIYTKTEQNRNKKESCMKKLILIAIFLIASCASPLDETKFKNPLFYQKMITSSKATHNTQLTPTSRIYLQKNNVEKCTLLENNETNILMKCTYINEKPSWKTTYYSRFASTGSSKFTKSCFIREEWYDSLPLTQESFSGWVPYTVEQIKGGCGPVYTDTPPYI